MRNGAVLIRYQNLEAQVLQVVISRLVGNLRGVGHIDIGPAGHRVVLAELDPRVVGVPLEPLVVGVAVAVQIFDICFQIVDHVFTVEGLTGIQHIVISLHTVGDAIDHHALIVGDHADDVGPAVDGDGLVQLVVGVAILVIIPAAVVVPALKHIVHIGCSTLSVVVRDLQLRNTNGIADFVIPHYRNRCIGCGGIAVAIDDYIDRLVFGNILYEGPAAGDGSICIDGDRPAPVPSIKCKDPGNAILCARYFIPLVVGRIYFMALACNVVCIALRQIHTRWSIFTPIIRHRIRSYQRSGRLLQCSRLTRLSPLCIRAKGGRFVGRVRTLSLRPTRVVQIGLDGEGNDQFISAVSGFTRVRSYCCSVFRVIKAGNFDFTRLFVDCNANLIGQFHVIRASPQISSVLINARKRKDLNGYPRAIRSYSISEGKHLRHGVGQRSLLSRDNVQGILDIILDLLEHRVQLFGTAGSHVVIPVRTFT